MSSVEPLSAASFQPITAGRVAIQWDHTLPVFAKEEFLRAVGDDYGWLGGRDACGTLRCILPYTVICRFGLRLVRFRVQPVTIGTPLNLVEERCFLNSVVEHFRSTQADMIVPGSNNAIFRTYPDGADAAPYGTYVIDLRQSEETLWKNIGRITRQNIGTARKDGVSIVQGAHLLEPAYHLIRDTFRRSRMSFMPKEAFKRFALGLGEQGRFFSAKYQGVAQSYCLFGYSAPCAYAIYAGNIEGQHQGAIKLLYWEAIRVFRGLGVRTFDFFGARLNPEKGSKQEAINQMKKRFGASLSEGYMWKYSLRPWRASVYSMSVRLLRAGDIVDQERHKLQRYQPAIGADR